MFTQIRDGIKNIVFWLFSLITKLDIPSSTIILNYHHIIPDDQFEDNLLFGYAHRTSSFDAQLKWLTAHFQSTTDFDKPNSFVITFDDCSQHTYEQALPILDRHGVKAYFFMVENTIGEPIWIDKYFFWLSYVPDDSYQLFEDTMILNTHASRLQVHHQLWSFYENKMDYYTILEAMNKAFPFSALNDRFKKVQKRMHTLSDIQLKSLKETGHYVGFHSLNHTQLSTLTKEELKLECNPKAPERYNISAFAIPFGSPTDYNDMVLDEVKSTGFHSILLNHPFRAKNNIFGRLNLPDTSNPLAINYHVKRYIKSIT